jgi:hypothetical protein
MTKLIHSQAKDVYPLIALISADCITRLNKIFNTHYHKGAVMPVTVERIKPVKDKGEVSKFFKRLMETKPGFDKGDN